MMKILTSHFSEGTSSTADVRSVCASCPSASPSPGSSRCPRRRPPYCPKTQRWKHNLVSAKIRSAQHENVIISDHSWSGPAGLHEGSCGEDARPPAAIREVPQVGRQGSAHPGRRALQDRRRRVQGQHIHLVGGTLNVIL